MTPSRVVSNLSANSRNNSKADSILCTDNIVCRKTKETMYVVHCIAYVYAGGFFWLETMVIIRVPSMPPKHWAWFSWGWNNKIWILNCLIENWWISEMWFFQIGEYGFVFYHLIRKLKIQKKFCFIPMKMKIRVK